MHAAFNTRNGQFGFIVETDDGRIFREDKVTWDEIPHDVRIKKLKIAHLPTDHAYLEMGAFARYFFSNQATTRRDTGLMWHVSKMFGGCKCFIGDEKAMVVKLGFERLMPQFLQNEEVSVASLGLDARAFRLGV